LTTRRLVNSVDDMAFVPTEEEAVPRDPAEGLAAGHADPAARALDELGLDPAAIEH
jgi:hypothetical protein